MEIALRRVVDLSVVRTEHPRHATELVREAWVLASVQYKAASIRSGVILLAMLEDEKLGPMADQVKEQVKETGQEALERGKQVAHSAAETARDEAQQQGQGLADSAREHAGSVSTS